MTTTERRRGFTPKRKIFRIEIEDGEYAGLFARVRGVPLGQFMDLAALAEGVDIESMRAGENRVPGAAALEAFGSMRKLFEGFAKALIEWNLEEPQDQEDDESPMVPVPPTVEGVMSQDFELIMFVVGEWIGAMGGTTPPNAGMPRPVDGPSGQAFPVETLAEASRPLSAVPN